MQTFCHDRQLLTRDIPGAVYCFHISDVDVIAVNSTRVTMYQGYLKKRKENPQQFIGIGTLKEKMAICLFSLRPSVGTEVCFAGR